MSAVANIIESMQHIEYDKKYKWLNCSDCGEITPPERYIPHDEKCLRCSQKDEMMYEKCRTESEQSYGDSHDDHYFGMKD